MIKTMEQLKDEWGLERYVPAIAKLSGFMLEHPHPIYAHEIQTLKDDSEDAFELFSSYMMYGTSSPEQEPIPTSPTPDEISLTQAGTSAIVYPKDWGDDGLDF